VDSQSSENPRAIFKDHNKWSLPVSAWKGWFHS
jgi:hypothetical protein